MKLLSGRFLFVQIVLMTLMGGVCGIVFPEFAQDCRVLSDLFLKLISMIAAPLIFCVLVQGIVGAESLGTVGRLGVKALTYFEAMTSIALGFGLLVAFVFQPGAGFTLPAQQAGTPHPATHGAGSVGEFFLHLVPLNPVDAFSRNDIIQVVVFAIIFGCAMLVVGKPAEPVARLIDALGSLFFQIMGFIIRLAPVGVFGAVSYTIAHYGLYSVMPLLAFLALYFLSVLFFVFVILGITLKVFGKISIFSLLRYLREEMLIVLATTSSDAVLPSVMSKLIRMGLGSRTVGIVIPAGYSFNLDALSLYLGLSILFLTQVAHVTLSWGQLLPVIITALLTAKGAHGVPGMAIVILSATLSMVPQIPGVGLILLVSVDWFVGIARAFGNIAGNCVAACVVARWENDIDDLTVQAILSHRSTSPDTSADLKHVLKIAQHGSPEGE
ncbi:cation:dicarboxylate symporter family transporter [Acetobacter okinawensis]|uniref:cation:dicarboxylate symporter family transporter n=1 Tax=Acetobacter okinawensis TaxID=1076594 RepID=UPI000A382C94|nr:cation:dicarboxylase symporter family transporter [Acetobacter okinawensis]